MNRAMRQFLFALARYVLLGGTAQENSRLRAALSTLDSDGDGVPDSEDAEPHNPAVRTRKPRKG